MTLAVILGWIALPIAILRYQVSGLKFLLGANALAGALMAGHYALSGLGAGAAMAATASASAFLQLCLGHMLPLRWRIAMALPAIFACIWLSAGQITGLVNLLPVLAFMIGRFAEIHRDDLKVRAISLLSTSTWIIYLSIEGSLPGLFFEGVGLTSNLIGLWRFHRDRIGALVTHRVSKATD